MLNQRWTHTALVAIGCVNLMIQQPAFAEDSSSESTLPTLDGSDDPLPKGFDESFKSGDLPKPISPELDPDLVDEEGNPEKKTTEAALNDFQQEQTPSSFLFGFTAGLTFPHVINLGVDTLFHKKYSVSINYGNVTRSLDNVDVALRHTDVRFRWFPWQTSFFTGLGVGQHRLVGELDRVVKEPTTKSSISTHGKLTTTANYVLPHFGWFAVWDSGFTAGFDLGYLVPFGAKSSFKSSFTNAPAGTDEALKETAEYKKLKKDLETNAKKYASKSIPFATFLRFGWMF